MPPGQWGVVWALCAVAGVAGLDATWTPADDNSLPLSKNYHDQLARLCELLDKNQLPASLPRATVQKQCAKLAAATRGASGSDQGIDASVWIPLVGLVVLLVGLQLMPQATGRTGENAAASRARAPGPTRDELKAAAERLMRQQQAAGKSD